MRSTVMLFSFYLLVMFHRHWALLYGSLHAHTPAPTHPTSPTPCHARTHARDVVQSWSSKSIIAKLILLCAVISVVSGRHLIPRCDDKMKMPGAVTPYFLPSQNNVLSSLYYLLMSVKSSIVFSHWRREISMFSSVMTNLCWTLFCSSTFWFSTHIHAYLLPFLPFRIPLVFRTLCMKSVNRRVVSWFIVDLLCGNQRMGDDLPVFVDGKSGEKEKEKKGTRFVAYIVFLSTVPFCECCW